MCILVGRNIFLFIYWSQDLAMIPGWSVIPSCFRLPHPRITCTHYQAQTGPHSDVHHRPPPESLVPSLQPLQCFHSIDMVSWFSFDHSLSLVPPPISLSLSLFQYLPKCRISNMMQQSCHEKVWASTSHSLSAWVCLHVYLCTCTVGSLCTCVWVHCLTCKALDMSEYSYTPLVYVSNLVYTSTV